MKKQLGHESLTTLALLLSLASAPAAWGQTFSSGSTGADGALNITSSFATVTVRPGGVYHHTTVNISGSVTYLKNFDNAPLVILATGDVNISGSLSVSGETGVSAGGTQGPTTGARGGPGGFNGGNGGYGTANPPISIAPTAGQGPGGGVPSTGVGGGGGTYGAPAGFVTGLPLFGGSGGGGGTGGTGHAAGASGGGGGGAVLIASSTRIIINGQIRANGGQAGGASTGCNQSGGAGSGGTIRLVAPEIIGTGTLQAIRGVHSVNCGSAQPGDGRIRMEAFSLSGFTGATNPIASVSGAPGPVSPAGNPALSNVPTLTIAFVGGMAVPATPAASYFTPDLTLPLGTTNPVPVVVTATNTPVGAPTEITVKLIPQGAASSIAIPAANHTGTFETSTATANLNLPVGQVAVIQAFAAMTLTGQTASLFPLIDGEPVERVMVAATPGEPSTLSLVTRSGREVPLDRLTPEERTRVAMAWQTMR